MGHCVCRRAPSSTQLFAEVPQGAYATYTGAKRMITVHPVRPWFLFEPRMCAALALMMVKIEDELQKEMQHNVQLEPQLEAKTKQHEFNYEELMRLV